MQYRPLNANLDRALLSDSVYCHWRQWVVAPLAGLEIRGSNGSKCYHVFSFATGVLMR